MNRHWPLVPEAETERILRHLRAQVEDSDLAHREIESCAGFTSGYLSQLLGGHIDLKLVHIFAIMEAVGRDPGVLFRSLYGASVRTTEQGVAETLNLPEDRDLASVYGIGIESLGNLRARLERCEDVLTDLKDSGFADGDETE